MARSKTAPNLDPQEKLRRRRERIIIVVSAFLIVTITLLETYLSKSRAQIPVTNNFLVYFLLNVNILLLILMTAVLVTVPFPKKRKPLVPVHPERKRPLGNLLLLRGLVSTLYLSPINQAIFPIP